MRGGGPGGEEPLPSLAKLAGTLASSWVPAGAAAELCDDVASAVPPVTPLLAIPFAWWLEGNWEGNVHGSTGPEMSPSVMLTRCRLGRAATGRGCTARFRRAAAGCAHVASRLWGAAGASLLAWACGLLAAAGLPGATVLLTGVTSAP